MNILCIFILALVPWSFAGDFCYDDSKGCGPNTKAWPELCQKGKQQSPINLPASAKSSGNIEISLKDYRGSSFRLHNNGHSVNFDFNEQGPSNRVFTFPDPIRVKVKTSRKYRFASGHFHWGVRDDKKGSEHCIGGNCAAMELHLVHYLAEYGSLEKAIKSKDGNALSVIGVLIGAGNGTDLKPIVENFDRIGNADHHSVEWEKIDQRLDISEILKIAAVDGMYGYKGSLTTPGCEEIVNWYVLKSKVLASHAYLESFRTRIKDDKGKILRENHRALQEINERRILYYNRVVNK